MRKCIRVVLLLTTGIIFGFVILSSSEGSLILNTQEIFRCTSDDRQPTALESIVAHTHAAVYSNPIAFKCMFVRKCALTQVRRTLNHCAEVCGAQSRAARGVIPALRGQHRYGFRGDWEPSTAGSALGAIRRYPTPRTFSIQPISPTA